MAEDSIVRIIGIGGAGTAVVKDVFALFPSGAEIAAVDTDTRALRESGIPKTLALTEKDCGTGGDITLAKQAADAHSRALESIAQGTKLLVLIAGLGGGTGSVIAPLVSKFAAANPDVAVLCFCIMPLSVEGGQRAALARKSFAYLSKKCAAVFELKNDVILARSDAPVSEAYAIANSNIVKAVYSLVKMLFSKGIVNVDLQTVKKIFSDSAASAFIGYGLGMGKGCVDEALEELLKSPLLKPSLKARNVLLSLVCGPSFEMNRMQYLLESASQKFGSPARVAFGAIADESFGDRIEVCAMGISEVEEPKAQPQAEEPRAEEQPSQTTAEAAISQSPAPQQNVCAAVSAPAPISSAAGKPPVLAAEERAHKRRRSFFSFKNEKDESSKKDEHAQTPISQGEFGFMELSQQRGFFGDTPPNIRNGIDLDVPTYMRRGIRIVL